MTPRLVATDLDGTIVCGDGTISARTVAAFAQVERAGARFVFVTGRPPRLMGDVVRAFGAHGTAICSNGALVYDLRTGEIVEENAIQVRVLAETARRLREAIPGIGLAVEFAHETASDELYEPWDWDRGVTLQRVADAILLGRPAPKLMGRHPEYSADDLLAMAKPVLDGLVNVYHSNGLRLVEAIAPGVSKASALADLAALEGIDPAEVIAFGDMPNDLPMLSWAGTSYGVANAHPDVRAAVDHVVGSNDDDGVAEVLEALFPGDPEDPHGP